LCLTVVAVFGFGCGGDGSGGGGNTNTTPAAVADQKWNLINDAGDQAFVIVKPFTYSGTFTEAADSPHWWLYDAAGNPVAKFTVGGNIVHSGGYDTWDFVTLGASGGGMQVLGTASGRTTDGVYPDAMQVDGTMSGTATSPLGTQQVSGRWTGVRIN